MNCGVEKSFVRNSIPKRGRMNREVESGRSGGAGGRGVLAIMPESRQCSATTKAGTRCRLLAIDALGLCNQHHPEYAGLRQRNAAKGGRSGGRGRSSPASAELRRLAARLEELAEACVQGRLDPKAGAVASQLYGQSRAALRDSVSAHEIEDLERRLERLEDTLEERNHASR